MGVKGFAKVFGEPTLTLKWKEFSGKTIAMDAMWELWQSTKASAFHPLTDSKGNNTGYLKILLSKVLKYMGHDIIPVYVFDNIVVTDLKNEENEVRGNTKNKAKEKYSKAKDVAKNKAAKNIDIDTDEENALVKLRRDATNVNSEMIMQFQEMLNYMGVAHFTSPPTIEGDKFCVCLQQYGYVDYIFTADKGDIIAFGGSSVMYPSTKSSTTYVNMIYSADIFKKYKLTYDKFVELCIALGTDFAPKSPGIGEKTVLTKKIVLSPRQEQAKDYFMSEIPKKLRTHMYVHKRYSKEKLTAFLYKLEFSIGTINVSNDKLAKFYE